MGETGEMKLSTLAATSAAVAGTAVLGGLVTDPKSAYYRTLAKPSWQPPGETFGLVWTPLYADIAVSSAVVLDQAARAGRDAEHRGYLAALGINLGLNAGWSALFFRSHRPWLAAAECALLTASSADLVRRAARIDGRAAAALAPYPAWCAFATALTVAIAKRNPKPTAAGNILYRLTHRTG